MAKRKPRTYICSGCHNEFLEKELYTIEKFVNRANPKRHGSIYKVYCKKCVKNTDQFYRIHEKPKSN